MRLCGGICLQRSDGGLMKLLRQRVRQGDLWSVYGGSSVADCIWTGIRTTFRGIGIARRCLNWSLSWLETK